MRGYDYVAPQSTEEALELLGRDGSVPIAGGTDLLVAMRKGLTRPRCLVDVTVLGMDYIREREGVLAIGATTTFSDIVDSRVVRDKVPALAEAAASIGSVQVRNLATIGGNLCAAVPSADSAPPLLALDGEVVVVGSGGTRSLPLRDLFTGPKQTALRQGELLVEIRVPLPPPGTGTCFLKVGRRRAVSLAVVNAAVAIRRRPDGTTVEDVRIALGAVAPTPVRAVRAEQVLRGQPFSEAAVEEAASVAEGEIAPISDIRGTAAYRRDVSRALVKRALLTAWDKANRQEGCGHGG